MVDYCSVTRILLLRHGQSTWNAEGRWQGWADPPLSTLGEIQTEQAAATLFGGVDAVVSSDLQRAKRTAEIFAERLAVGPVEPFPGLRERDVGELTGLTRHEIDERWPGLLEPGSPLVPTLLARAIASLHRLAERHPDRQVLAVSHGALIRTVEGHLGVEHGPTPNLAGRWLIVTGAGLAAGDRAALLPGEPAIVTG
jgi:probable phosphoglycerate mutase